MYTLTGDEVFALMESGKGPSSFKLQGEKDSYPGSYVTSSATSHTAGTEDFFTVLYAANSRIDPVEKTFDDNYTSHYRINLQNKAETSQNAIRFQTDGPATVTVWWIGGAGSGKPARSMTILDSAGKVSATSTQSSASTETPMVSTMELPEGGTYYLGGDIGKNFIHKVTVSVGGDSLGWSVAEDTLSITGDVGADQAVWAACWDESQGFLGARLLTGVDPTAGLPQGWKNVKLMWLRANSAPKCPAAETVKK